MAWWHGRTARLAVTVMAVGAGLLATAAEPASAFPSGWRGVSVNPGSGLLDAQPVTVTGLGYTPGSTATARQCFGPQATDCSTSADGAATQVTIAPDGTFEVDLIVFRTATVNGEAHDCMTDPCTVQLNGHIDLPISFAPTGSYEGPPASLSVSPATELLDGHRVDVAGSGFTPGGGQILVTQCGPGPALTDCALPRQGSRVYLPPNVALLGSVGEDGSLATDLLLERTISAEREVDCVAEACSVRAYFLVDLIQGVDEPLATTPVSFAPSGAYQWPQATLSVSQSTGVRDGQEVQVTGAGYSRWVLFSPAFSAIAPVETCRAVADPDPEADCVQGWPRFFHSVDDFRREYIPVVGGEVDGAVTLRRWLDLPSGEWDCAVGGCTVALSQSRNPVSNRVALSFGPEWLPYASADAFVDAAYGQMIGTTLAPSDRSRLITALTSRGTTGAQAIVDATAFPGYQPTIPADRHDQVVADVTRTYVAFFGRRPDTPGLAYWVGRRETGTSAGQVARLFGGTPEFEATYAGLTDEQVVERAYRRILGRASDPEGRSYWLGQLAAGMTRDRMVHIMSAVPEHRARHDAHARIEVITFGLKGRAATATEWASTPLAVARAVLAAG